MSQKKFTPPKPEELDSLFPSYSVTSLLSKTKNCASYSGVEIETNLPVRIEIHSPSVASVPTFQDLFQSQLAEFKTLKHPNIAEVYDYGQAGEMPFVISELINGKSLADASNGIVVDAEQAAGIVMAVAEGIGYAHGQGIFHTDIKPQNIFLNEETVPYLTNFGSYTKIHPATGKPDYGSPGYAAHETLAWNFSYSSDLYSLGAVFYELITGILPSLPYKRPSEFESCDNRFDHFMEKTLSRRMEKRPCSAEELVAMLSEALHQSAPPLPTSSIHGTIPVNQSVPRSKPAVSPVFNFVEYETTQVTYKGVAS